MSGCASTASSPSGAAQDDVPVVGAPESGSPASASPPVASAGPSQSSAPVPVEPTAAPASSGPPLLGSSSNGPCDNGMEYSCGDTGPAGGIIVYVIKDGFSLSNGYSAACSNDCNYLEAQPSALPGSYPWCVGQRDCLRALVVRSVPDTQTPKQSRPSRATAHRVPPVLPLHRHLAAIPIGSCRHRTNSMSWTITAQRRLRATIGLHRRPAPPRRIRATWVAATAVTRRARRLHRSTSGPCGHSDNMFHH